MENMEKEAEYIFKKTGVIDPVAVMNKIRNNTIRPIEKTNKKISYTDYWKNITTELIDEIRFYYRYEIFLHDYPETPFIIPT